MSSLRLPGAARNSAKDQTIWALKDIDFEVKRGEVLGVIGRNGAGKSTLLKILSRITEPTVGYVDVYGRVGSLLEVGTGFHPELTGRENTYLNGAILGMKASEIQKRFDEIVAFAEVERFIDTPVKRYSSGMYLRLAFAVAAHLETEILLVDEVLAVGDAEFQKRCLGKIGDAAETGRTILFVSHNMEAVQRLCTSAILLEDGKVGAQGTPAEVISSYLGAQAASGQVELEDERTEEIILHRVAIEQEGRIGSDFLDYMKPIDITIEYEVLNPVRNLLLGFDLLSSSGVQLFRSYDLAASGSGAREPGCYKSICRIPAGLLNIGSYHLRLLAAVHREKWITRDRISLRMSLGGSCPHDVNFPGLLWNQGDWRISRTADGQKSCRTWP
jgi:lipopolysaccharide transport system ATP-binding protein